jgi:hypothetical protein
MGGSSRGVRLRGRRWAIVKERRQQAEGVGDCALANLRQGIVMATY